MNAGLVMRSPKFRILLYILILGVACLMMILIHNSHVHLKEVENYHNICKKEKEKCERGKDLVSAQLQVLYDRKKEMETLLQQERSEHQKVKEGMEKKSLETQAIQSQLEKEMNELQLKHSQLLSDYNLLKDKNNQMENKIAEMKQAYSVIEEEKKNLNFEVSNHLQALHQKIEEINKLQEHLKKVSFEKEQLYHTNSQLSWKMNQCDNKLTVCQRQHHQLMLQFDEVSLHLNNCINLKNFTSQEKLILKQKLNIENRPTQNPILQFEHNESNSNEKFVHIPDTKVPHPFKITENKRTSEETIIGSEFNETINMNISVPYVDNVNGENRQLDVPIADTVPKEKLNISLKNTSSNMTESTVSNQILVQHESTKLPLNNQFEKTLNQLPLPVPHIANNSKFKTDKINMTNSITKVLNNNINIVKLSNFTDVDLHQKNKIVNPKKININKSNLAISNATSSPTIILEFHPNQPKNNIKYDNLEMNEAENVRHSSFEMVAPPDYVRPNLQNKKDIQLQKEIPFDNEINASRMDGDYNQDQQLDNIRADYDNDRNLNSIPEKPDYF